MRGATYTRTAGYFFQIPAAASFAMFADADAAVMPNNALAALMDVMGR